MCGGDRTVVRADAHASADGVHVTRAAPGIGGVIRGWNAAAAPPARRRRAAPQGLGKGTPRTRQSPLTLAAFRPWGGSQDARRAGSVGQCSASCAQTHPPGPPPPADQALHPRHPTYLATGRGLPVCCSTEDSPSGLWRSPGTRVGLTPSGVQIPYPPPRKGRVRSGFPTPDPAFWQQWSAQGTLRMSVRRENDPTADTRRRKSRRGSTPIGPTQDRVRPGESEPPTHRRSDDGAPTSSTHSRDSAG